MNSISLNQKLIAAIIAIGTLLILIFQQGFYNQKNPDPPVEPASQNTEEINVVSTNPTPLDGATIHATQTVEVSFNQPIENLGELKWTQDPVDVFEAKLSDDRKTVKFSPKKSLTLGQGYTIFIKPDTKFDGKKLLGKELIYRLSTIDYRGV